MNMQTGPAQIVKGDVTERAQYLTLLRHRDALLAGSNRPRVASENAPSAVRDAVPNRSFTAKSEMVENASSPGSGITTKVRSPALLATSFDSIDSSRGLTS